MMRQSTSPTPGSCTCILTLSPALMKWICAKTSSKESARGMINPKVARARPFRVPASFDLKYSGLTNA
ncbi:exported hypothetical protein [Arthrobacter sp. 9V]|nr:exported hypothetical protein [Arthrobacter sp. 9V]